MRTDPAREHEKIGDREPIRVPLGAEQSVLGSMLISTPALDKAGQLLRPDDFGMASHQTIFRTMLEMAGRGAAVDLVTVADEMANAREDEDQTGGARYLNSLVESVPTAVHVVHYAEQVMRGATFRRLARVGAAIQDLAENGEDDLDVLDESERRIAEVRERRLTRVPAILSAPELMAEHYSDPVWMVDGLLTEGVAVLAGPPKARKSFWALGVGLSVAFGTKALGAIPVTRTGGLLVFLEDGFRDVQIRMKQLLNDEPAPANLHVAQQCPRMDEGGELWLSQWLAGHPEVGLVVLDPLIRVRGGQSPRDSQGNAYANDVRDMDAFTRIVARHPCCLLILHHTRKMPADDWLNRLNGTTGLTGSADAVMLLQGERGADQATLRAAGRRVRDTELALRWDDHTGWVSIGEAKAVNRSQEQTEALDALRSFNGEPASQSAFIARLMEQTGIKWDAARRRVQRYADAGLYRHEGSLYWMPQNVSSVEVVHPVQAVSVCPDVQLSGRSAETAVHASGWTGGQTGQVNSTGQGGQQNSASGDPFLDEESGS